jgi:hypothetical protein
VEISPSLWKKGAKLNNFVTLSLAAWSPTTYLTGKFNLTGSFAPCLELAGELLKLD